MSVIYERCTEDVGEVADELIRKFHTELIIKGKPVEIDYLFAQLEPDSNGDRPTGAAVKLHGIACYAKVKIVSAKDRAIGRKDAEVVIDKDQWEKMPAGKRRALLDHELEHLEVKRDSAGFMVLDAYERPRLRLRHHDWDLGWFNSIAERHNQFSIEVQQARRLANESGKLYFQAELPFFEIAA